MNLSTCLCFLLLLFHFTSSENSLLTPFISKMLSNFFPQCRIFVSFADFSGLKNKTSDKWAWTDKLAQIVSIEAIIHFSGGIINLKVDSHNSHIIPVKRPPKSQSEVTQVVILILPNGISSGADESFLRQRINLPLLGPPTVKNVDKYIIVTKISRVKPLYGYSVFRKLKYKLVLTESVLDSTLVLHQFCLHCPVQEVTFPDIKLNFTQVSDYFPDFQRNHYGYVLKATATDKMYGDLEFAKDPKTGKDYAKRGIFAIILKHLSLGLNFTGETFRSSGGGSTGTPFLNGTWIGSVGDVYYGDATFCMLCSISLSRNTVIDMCSPVTYEYVKFAIGPTAQVHTWQSLFWPFDLFLWIVLLLTTVFVIGSSFIFLKYNIEHTEKNYGSTCPWNIFSLAQYYGRIFIEQSDELPVTLPQPLRIIIGFWLLFTLVGTTLYKAKMVTFMTFPVFEPAPQTFDELVASDYQIEFHYFPNIAYNSFRLSTNPVMNTVFQKLIKEPDPVKCMQHTLTSKSVCIMFTSVHEDTINRNISDMFGQSPIKAAPGYAYLFSPGIVLEKMADVYPNFKWILSNSLQMGLNEHWQKSDSFRLLQQRNAWVKSLPPDADRSGVFQHNPESSNDILHLKHLKGAYVVFFTGLITALATFVFEICKNVTSKVIDGRWLKRANNEKHTNDGSFEMHHKIKLVGNDVDDGRMKYSNLLEQ